MKSICLVTIREIGHKCLKKIKKCIKNVKNAPKSIKSNKNAKNSLKKFCSYNMEYLKHICSLESIV